MTDKEANFYRFLETFTLEPTEQRGNPHYEFALARGRCTRERLTGNLIVTDSGWCWFAGRGAAIIARCSAGHHDMKQKTPFCVGEHCQWCGACATTECAECEKFRVSGTIEGGWQNAIEAPHESRQYSSINHGREHD